MNNHLVRMRLKTTEQLQAEITRLELLNSGFASQNLGTKAFTIAIGNVMDQLEAASYVLAERGFTVIIPSRLNPNIGTIDFSGVNDPSSTNQQGYGYIG